MESIGNRLRDAREEKGLSIEDAAHQTRIQAIYIRGLENDDFSNFPSTTYAKSFLTLYSRFLGVDAGEALEMFSGGDAISLSGQGYLESVTDNIEPRRPSSAYASGASRPSAPRRSRENSPGLAPVFLGLVLVALVIAIPTLWMLGKDADSIDEVVTKGKELTNANFSASDPKAEAVEPVSSEKKGENGSTQEPPAAPATQETKPVKVEAVPTETKMAQATPTNSGRTLNHSPGGASPVITGAKPEIAGATAPLQAKPVVPGTVASKPENAPSSPPSPAISTNPGQPLRAVPLIARPVVILPEGESEAAPQSDKPETGENTAEETTVEEDADLRGNGNQFPRPLE